MRFGLCFCREMSGLELCSVNLMSILAVTRISWSFQNFQTNFKILS
jgi:hypothetical protein